MPSVPELLIVTVIALFIIVPFVIMMPVIKYFPAEYSRKQFWIWSLILMIANIPVAIIDKAPMGNIHNANPLVIGLIFLVASLPTLFWIRTLANRIRDYGSNPYIALWAIIPLVNMFLGLYYGIVKYKKKDNVFQGSQDNSNASLAKAVKNHAKDIAEDTKENIKEYKVNHQTQKSKTLKTTPTVVQSTTIEEEQSDIVDTDEDAHYEQALQEIEEGNQVKSIWAKALAKSDGVESKSKSLYIKYRVEDLKNKERKKQLEFETLQKNNQLKNFLEENKLLNQVKKISKTKVIANHADSPIDVCIEFINGEWKIIADYNSAISYYINPCR